MILEHVNVKIFVDGASTVDLERVIRIFHGWVAQQVMEELLIDVADYRHVPNGPGVVLVGHEADYALDFRDGRPGLLYNRKAALPGTNHDRFGQAFRSALHACQLLEAELDGQLQFDRQQFEFIINDRALAPNTPETFRQCQPEFAAFLQAELGHDAFQIQHLDDPRCRFGVSIVISRPWQNK